MTHWTAIIKLIENVDEPAVMDQYNKEKIPPQKFDREDAKFIVSKDSRNDVIATTIKHLQLEQDSK